MKFVPLPYGRSLASLPLLLVSLPSLLILFLVGSVGTGRVLQAQAQGNVTTSWNPWETEQSNTTEALRGIHAVGSGVAWASGGHGTVLRTEDAGYLWQRCAVPDGAAALDFRAIWAWDAKTAIVMSSGAGADSRLFLTTDGCEHWRLLHTNTDADGFWDALAFSDDKNGFLLGDPVKGHFVLLRTADRGERWTLVRSKALSTGTAKIGAFAASNSALVLGGPSADPKLSNFPMPWFGTSGVSGGPGPFVYRGDVKCAQESGASACLNGAWSFDRAGVPITGGSPAAGIFALGWRQDTGNKVVVLAVGGDYTKPGETGGTAAYRDQTTGGWVAATKLPHGYRSAVGWDADEKAWIAVGPNGSDVSYDDGRSWATLGDQGYNAISLPWVVGANGHIARLGALKKR